MTQKYEFASPGWFKFLHETMETLTRDAPDDLRWGVCEVFTDVPEHLSQTPNQAASWHCYIRGSDVKFGHGEIHDADFKVVADYQTVLPLARLVLGDEPDSETKVAQALEKAVRDGKIRIEGSRESRPTHLEPLHDAMARVTA